MGRRTDADAGSAAIYHPTDQGTAMIFKPFSPYGVIWKDTFYLSPEGAGVVHLFPVAQFMNNNIIDDLRGSKHEKAVEVQSLGLRKISERFSHSRKRDERVMYTAQGKVYLKIRNRE